MIESIINTEEKKEIIKNQESNTSEIKPKKIKKKKKAKKKKPEKECKNLKELLDEIKQEKDQKLLKEKKLKEKKKAIEENQLKENLNFINRSTSCTTTGASSLDDFNLPNYLLINNNDISENEPSEESFNKKRKMSSPIFNYYNGYDKFLSSEKELSIDLTNSANFIEKNKFITSYELNELNTNHINININPNINEVEKNYNENNNFNPNEIKYTWWSYMFQARSKDIGWRIDYFIVNKDFINKVKSTKIYTDVLGSDHCPIGIEIE